MKSYRLLICIVATCWLLSAASNAQLLTCTYVNGTNVVKTIVTGDVAGTAVLSLVKITGDSSTSDLKYWFQASGQLSVVNAVGGLHVGDTYNWSYNIAGIHFYPGDSSLAYNIGGGVGPGVIGCTFSPTGTGPAMTLNRTVTGTINCPGVYNASLLYTFQGVFPDGTTHQLGLVRDAIGQSGVFFYSVPYGTIISWSVTVDPSSGVGFSGDGSGTLVSGGSGGFYHDGGMSLNTSNSPTTGSTNSIGLGPTGDTSPPAPANSPTSNPTPVSISGAGGAAQDATLAAGINSLNQTLTTVGNALNKQVSDGANSIVQQLQNGVAVSGGTSGGGSGSGTDNAGIESRLDTIISDAESAPGVSGTTYTTSNDQVVSMKPDNAAAVTGLTALLPAAPNIVAPGRSETVASGSVPIMGHSVTLHVSLTPMSDGLATVRAVFSACLGLAFFMIAVRTVRGAFAG